ncbi:hypothetical protein [Shewanella sp. HL-SH2]|uniref:hypothetical protein n=1 Tax=Shewanella sp. HL-SH2 TaxID=3436238 RepID=UPI003EBB4DCC
MTNVVLKNYTSPEVYSSFVIVQIFIGYVFTLGFLGADSVLLRFSTLVRNKIEVDFILLLQLLISWVLACFCFVFFVGDYIGLKYTYSIYFLIFIIISLVFLCSIITRLKSEFFISQFYLNSWKIAFFLLVLIAFFIDSYIGVDALVNYVVISFSVSLLFCLKDVFRLFTDVLVIPNESSSFKNIVFQYSFFMSFVFFAVLGSFDRVFLEGILTDKEFSEYAYLITLLIFPLGIISNYIGYKELVSFKAGKEINLVDSLRRIVLFSSILYVFYSVILYSVKDLISLDFDFKVFFAAFIIAICKVPYSLLSSIMGAKSSSNDILKINHMSLGLLSVVCVVNLFFKNVYFCIYSISFVWMVRTYLYYLKSKNYV